MTHVAMVKLDERNSKFCSAVEKEERESWGAGKGEPYQKRDAKSGLHCLVRLNYSSDLEDSLIQV